MATFEVSVKGDGIVAKDLSDLGNRARDTAPALNDVLDVIMVGERKLFAKARWLPIAESTAALRRSRGQGTKPLIATGKLMALLTTRAGILKFTKEEIRFGTRSKEYAIATKRGGHRKALKITPRQRKEMRDIIRDHIVGDDS